MDKESYVYLYRDAAQKRGRLEIANHAGTQDQDAFTGYLDSAKIINSFKHPTLVTVVVDGVKQLATPTQTSEHHWRLPSTDPRDEGNVLQSPIYSHLLKIDKGNTSLDFTPWISTFGPPKMQESSSSICSTLSKRSN